MLRREIISMTILDFVVPEGFRTGSWEEFEKTWRRGLVTPWNAVSRAKSSFLAEPQDT